MKGRPFYIRVGRPLSTSGPNPIRRLRLIALLSLASVALLTLLSQAVLGRMTGALAADARLMLIAGRQSALSRQIGGVAGRLGSGEGSGTVGADELDRLVREWVAGDASIRARVGPAGLGGENSVAALAILEKIRPHFDRAVEGSRALIAEARSGRGAGGPSEAARAEVLAGTGRFASLMDDLASLYESESVARVERLRAAQLGVCGLVIAVLFVQGFWVFEPSAREVRRQHRSLSAQSAELSRLAEIVEKTSNAVVLTDAAGRVTWVNAGFVRLTGYTLEEVLGKKPGDVLQSELTDAATVGAIRAALGEGRGFRGELLNRSKDGRDYWIDMDIQPRKDRSGRVIGFMAIESDITPLVNSRQRLAAVFEAAADAIIELDADGRIVGCNPASEAMFGMTRDEIIGRCPHDPRWKAVREDGTEFPADEHPAIITLRTGAPIRSSVHGIRSPDGGLRWISVSTRAMRDAGGRVTGVVSSVADVTEQREESLRAEMIIRGANVGTWDWDIRTGFVRFNERWANMLGYAVEEIEPHLRSWERLIHPDDLPAVRRALDDHLARRTEVYTSQHRLRRKDGSWAWVHDAGRVSERDGDGAPLRASGIHLDITESKELERSLREARARAQDANAAKSEFLANMSHEIRTPMTAILGYADLIEEMSDDAYDAGMAREYARTIQRNGDHLLSIINDILDISKIEAGRMNIERVETEPLRLLHEIESLMRVRASAKGIGLRVMRQTPIPRSIVSDPTRIRQILVNLVGNAIKFTELGCVTLRASLDASGPGGPCLRFEVEDTGIGIEQEQMERLFQAFTQADASTTRRFGGSGLGLRISKQLCEMLGGTIRVRSEPGVGSVFTAAIPTGDISGVAMIDPDEEDGPADEPEPVASSATAGPLPLGGCRIYFVEDGPDNQRLIGFHLRRAGAEVTLFSNGLECLNAMTRSGTPDGPLKEPGGCDLILTDMQMPGMDGYTLARTLRRKGYTGRIVALTAHAMPADIRRCIEAGCDDYASKPIDRAELIRVCRADGGRAGRGSAA